MRGGMSRRDRLHSHHAADAISHPDHHAHFGRFLHRRNRGGFKNTNRSHRRCIDHQRTHIPSGSFGHGRRRKTTRTISFRHFRHRDDHRSDRQPRRKHGRQCFLRQPGHRGQKFHHQSHQYHPPAVRTVAAEVRSRTFLTTKSTSPPGFAGFPSSQLPA